MVPDRAGSDTRVDVQIPLSALREMPGASAVEEAWLRARAGEPGYLAGKDAEAAAPHRPRSRACDRKPRADRGQARS